MIFRNANVVTDYEPQELQGSAEVHNLTMIQELDNQEPVKTKPETVIITIEKPKPKIISFANLISSIKDYFSDPIIKEELIQQISKKVKEKCPFLKRKVIYQVVRAAILPMITITIIAVNQVQYYM